LSSTILLEQMIEYSPIERELVWSFTDPIERRNFRHLLTLRSYLGSLFHEQNHRILWRYLPPLARSVGKEGELTRRYLNFAEGLVIALDIALGDTLGERLAKQFYLVGINYDPGSETRSVLKGRRLYRNYLQAALYATYLKLEHYEPRDISRIVEAKFPSLGPYANRVAQRTDRLSLSFVMNTNPRWQKQYRAQATEILSAKPASRERYLAEPLALPEDPADDRLIYLIGERVFEQFGL
jgi:hypothetical protein